MISYHLEPADRAKPWKYSSKFKVAEVHYLPRVANCLKSFVWSGIVWKRGERLSSNFEMSDFAVFDFESYAYPLAQALRDFCDTQHVIGTTHNHQVAKGGHPPVDRFRILVPWKTRIIERDVYEFNMKFLTEKYPMDPVCKDAARFFYPCKEIVSIQTDGEVLDVYPPTKNTPRRSSAYDNKRLVPPWAHFHLNNIVPTGERSVTFHRVAKDLVRCGFTHMEIEKMIVQSATYDGKPDDHAAKKVTEAIKSAEKAVLLEQDSNDI